MSITVVQVIRDMGIEPMPELTWVVGALVRDAYELATGVPPEKHLRPKTNAGGTHCHAIYPDSWRPRIERIVRGEQAQAASQMELFK